MATDQGQRRHAPPPRQQAQGAVPNTKATGATGRRRRRRTRQATSDKNAARRRPVGPQAGWAAGRLGRRPRAARPAGEAPGPGVLGLGLALFMAYSRLAILAISRISTSTSTSTSTSALAAGSWYGLWIQKTRWGLVLGFTGAWGTPQTAKNKEGRAGARALGVVGIAMPDASG
jgi:hypothetical protein